MCRPRALLAGAAFVSWGLLAAAGCGGGDSSPITAAQPGWSVLNTAPVYGTKPWTVLVYMNGANNLDADSVLNVSQMESVGSSTGVNIVVQWKRDTGFRGATRRYYIQKNTTGSTMVGASSAELSTNATADMGKAQTLQDFVQWGVHAFPAQRYCLVLWDHGAGWRAAQPVPAGKSAVVPQRAAKLSGRGISYDDLTGSHIDTSELNGAITVGGSFKWDLLAMDASLMQMAEVDYQMRGQTQYIVGSEESPSELGYPYDKFLADLVANKFWGGKTLGIDIAQQTATYYAGAGEDETYTQSVIDSSKLGALAPAISSLGTALVAAASGASSAQIAAARNAAESVLSPDYYGDYRDLDDFVHQLIDTGTGLTPITDAGVVSAAKGVRTALSAAIVFNVHGTQHPNMHGLTIFLVAPAEYQSINTAQQSGLGPGYGDQLYTDLAFTQAAPGWLSFLTAGPS